MKPNDKTNLDITCDIYISDLSTRNAWPDQLTSMSMAQEALIQANQWARNEGRDVTDADISSTFLP